MARLHHEDIFSPIRFDTSLTDSSINSGGSGSITSISNTEREMCLSFKDASYEKCLLEMSEGKSVGKRNEMTSNISGFENTLKSERSEIHRQCEIISRKGTLPSPAWTKAIAEDVFSPVHFDTSLADSSINSGGSTASASNIEKEICLAFKDVTNEKNVFEFSDLKSDEMGSSTKIIGFEKVKSKNPVVSDLSFTPKKDSSLNLVNKKKIASNLKPLNIDKRTSKKGNISVKQNMEIKGNLNKSSNTTQNSGRESSEINDMENKKFARPTSLLSTKNKMTESNNSKDIKKMENKIVRKSASSKNANDQDVGHKRESGSSEKNYLNRSISGVGKNITPQKSNEFFVKHASRQNGSTDNLEKDKSEKLQDHLEDSMTTSNLPLQSENLIIEKMVHDHVSFECDKIRQNIYSHQMSFYRKLNRIKDEMKQQHSITTGRLFKRIEELMHFNVLLKEKL